MRILAFPISCIVCTLASHTVFAADRAESLVTVLTPTSAPLVDEMIELKNDSFVDGGGQAFLQMGFVTGEKAGIWVRVPADVPYFKVDYFRVLIGDENVAPPFVTQAFFEMGVADTRAAAIPREIENAVNLTPGPYWNDVPAMGETEGLRCARAGQYIGAALEFAHTGTPSVYRDIDGLSSVNNNTLYAIPGGWNYSATYGLRGDWVLRVIGHAVTAAECQ
jgi:hypothetical protein